MFIDLLSEFTVDYDTDLLWIYYGLLWSIWLNMDWYGYYGFYGYYGYYGYFRKAPWL